MVISGALFWSTFTISLMSGLLNKLKSNLPFTKDTEINTSIEPSIKIKKIFDNKLFIGDQNSVTLAASLVCLYVSVEGLKSKNISWLIHPLLAFL